MSSSWAPGDEFPKLQSLLSCKQPRKSAGVWSHLPWGNTEARSGFQKCRDRFRGWPGPADPKRTGCHVENGLWWGLGGAQMMGTPRRVLRTLGPVSLFPSARRWGCSTKGGFWGSGPLRREPAGNLQAGAKDRRPSTESHPPLGWGGKNGSRVGPICQSHSSGSDLSAPQSPLGFPSEANCLGA